MNLLEQILNDLTRVQNIPTLCLEKPEENNKKRSAKKRTRLQVEQPQLTEDHTKAI